MMLASPLLSAIPGLRHAFFTRDGGASEGIYQSLNGGIGSNDDPTHVAENRRRMAQRMEVAPAHFLSVWQIHSPDTVIVTGAWAGERPRADAMVTRAEGLALGVTAADCGPVLLVDPNARVIGAAQAGWKGALTGIVESTVTAMEKLGAARGAELLHRRDGGFDDAGQRALPAGLRRPDHARVRVDQQDRAAIGRGDAERKPFRTGDHGVRARPLARPGAGHDHRVRRMDLPDAEEMRRCDLHPLGHPAAVLRDMGGIVVGADAAIEALIDALGRAAVAGEESVAQPGNCRQQRRSEHHAGSALASGFSSSKPARAAR